jgi:crotonobetainyl-CoA:carnitine CoA-transferase CaiB-like acyl-CoA transferase
MKEDEQMLLAPYRVLDLADEKGLLCGKIFADMGADVIKVERPGGDPARRIGPFYHDDPDPEKSLYWFAYNTNKRGITLNLETADGREIFKKLVKSADMVIESFEPGYMSGLGLGYEDLEKINKKIVMVSITPFGQTGPYVDQKYKFNDMIVWALSGFMHPNGEPDRAPNQITFPQAYLNGAAEAAAGAMTALYACGSTGEGQHVDVSIQQALQTCNQMSMPLWDMYGVNSPRGLLKGGAAFRPDGSVVKSRAFYPCKDGWIFMLLGGGALKSMSLSGNALVELMDEEGMAGDLKGYDWSTYDASKIPQEEIDHQQLDIIGPYLKTKTKLEFYEEAIKRKILGCPFQDPKDLAESPQLAARNFLVPIEHPELNDTITHCGPFIKLSVTPLKKWRRAPLMGEHNLEVYEQELGYTADQLHGLKQAGII